MLQGCEAADGVKLAYRLRPGAGPVTVFLPGYRSDMMGGKALALDEACAGQGRAMLRLDYAGHGESEGVFEQGTIGRWAEDAATVIRAACDGPLILVGSSMGGWIALLLARALGERVHGLVLIAPAPDFTEELMWRDLTPDQRRQVMEQGGVHLPNPYGDPYWVSRDFIEDGRQHLLLNAPIAITAPTRLLHGQRDASVPWQTSLRIAERLVSDDVRVTLIKDGDHRLSRPQDLALLIGAVGELAQNVII